MWITGVETGKQFEDLMIRVLRDSGMIVHDTPVSNDYGADLVVEYNGHRIAGQCKYYENTVGVKAVQEVLGSLAYYQCDAGVVITNSEFTQQAVNLASANQVLLIDGDMLEEYFEDFSKFRYAFNQLFRNIGQINNSNQRQEEEWVINDLVIRYRVSSQTIMRNFLGNGLPFYKVCREYRFNSKDVFWWEVDTHYVPYGKSNRILLPGHVEYREMMNERINEAKITGDREAVKKYKKLMRAHHVSRIDENTAGIIRVVVPTVIAFAFFASFILKIWRF